MNKKTQEAGLSISVSRTEKYMNAYFKEHHGDTMLRASASIYLTGVVEKLFLQLVNLGREELEENETRLTRDVLTKAIENDDLLERTFMWALRREYDEEESYGTQLFDHGEYVSLLASVDDSLRLSETGRHLFRFLLEYVVNTTLNRAYRLREHVNNQSVSEKEIELAVEFLFYGSVFNELRQYSVDAVTAWSEVRETKKKEKSTKTTSKSSSKKKNTKAKGKAKAKAIVDDSDSESEEEEPVQKKKNVRKNNKKKPAARKKHLVLEESSDDSSDDELIETA